MQLYLDLLSKPFRAKMFRFDDTSPRHRFPSPLYSDDTDTPTAIRATTPEDTQLYYSMEKIGRRQKYVVMALVVFVRPPSPAKPTTHGEYGIIQYFLLCMIGSAGDRKRTKMKTPVMTHFWHRSVRS